MKTCCEHHGIASCRQGRDCPERSSLDVIGGVMLNGLLAVVLVAVVICLSGWMGYFSCFYR